MVMDSDLIFLIPLISRWANFLVFPHDAREVKSRTRSRMAPPWP